MLLGFHGRAQAGKDTAFQRLEALLTMPDVTVERRAFADKLYASAAAALGVTPELLSVLKTSPGACVEVIECDRAGGIDVNASLSVRKYLQNYGTEAHREVFGTDFWVDQLDTSHEGRVVCVTDVRFDNEAEAVRRAGGFVVHVLGPDEVEAAPDSHASEAGLSNDYIDFNLFNTERDDGFRDLDANLELLLDYVRCAQVSSV